MIRQQGYDVTTATSAAQALAIMRGQMFDAMVVDTSQDSLDILNFTAKAQGLQPSLAVFFADEWGDELAIGLKDFGSVLTMLQDDECTRLAVSG